MVLLCPEDNQAILINGKNLEINPSLFYCVFPHGILRDLYIDLKTTV